MFLRHFDKLFLAVAMGWLLYLFLPSQRARDVAAIAARVKENLARVDEHFARGSFTSPPAPLTELEGRASTFTRLPPAPAQFPAWCLERRPAFMHQVERDPQPPSTHEPPLDLVADASEPGLVRVSWRANPASARVQVAYALERRIDQGAWTRIVEPGEPTAHVDRAAPFGHPLRYRVIARATPVQQEGEPEPLPLAAERVALTIELSGPVQTFREWELRLTDGWVAPLLANQPSWASLVVRQLGKDRAELAKRSLLRVEVGQPIGESGAVLLSLESRERQAKFAKVMVAVPVARIRWADGVEEELSPP